MKSWAPWIKSNVARLELSDTLATRAKCRALTGKGERVYDLGIGESPFPILPSVVEELQKYAFVKQYLPSTGDVELKRNIVKFHQLRDGITADPDYVALGAGSKMLIRELLFILQRKYKQFEVILPSPSWGSFFAQSKMHHCSIRTLETNFVQNWKFSPAQFKAACQKSSKPKLLILNYPANPTGQTYSFNELLEIADIARRYGVMILSDEIYSLLTFNGQHTSMFTLYPEGTIYSSGLSKWAGAAGWRLGYLIFPESMRELHKGLIAVLSESISCPAAPIQFAARLAYHADMKEPVDRYLFNVKKILAALGHECAAILKTAGIQTADPQGGFHLFLDFSSFQSKFNKLGIANCAQFRDFLLDKTGVALITGAFFGRPAAELSARLSYVRFDGGNALQACESFLDRPIDKEFLETYCSDTITACRTIAEFTKK